MEKKIVHRTVPGLNTEGIIGNLMDCKNKVVLYYEVREAINLDKVKEDKKKTGMEISLFITLLLEMEVILCKNSKVFIVYKVCIKADDGLRNHVVDSW